jgi:hypothetical protein
MSHILFYHLISVVYMRGRTDFDGYTVVPHLTAFDHRNKRLPRKARQLVHSVRIIAWR